MANRSAFYIGGSWTAPSSKKKIEVISPHSGQVIAVVPEAQPADVDAAVAAARTAFDTWSATPFDERVAIVERFSAGYAARMPELAEVITAEIGTPSSLAQAVHTASTWMALNTFIDIAKQYPWEETRSGVFGSDVIVRREAVGVVGAIVPWNGPQYLTMAKLAPALLTGCTVVLKPSPEAPLDAFVLAEILDEAGVPAGVVNVIPGGTAAGEHLVRHPGVDKISFTGSTVVGRRIAKLCGKGLKRCSLELGGKSAAIILDDADLDSTVESLKLVSLVNSGQACGAQTRILASRSRSAEVVDRLAAMIEGLKVGDPTDPETYIGPLVSKRQWERVEDYIAIGEIQGARMVVGGRGRPDGLNTGWYVKPTLFADATNDMRIAREEIFGPVLTVIPFDSVDGAVSIANDSDYGLGGSVWTADIDLGLEIARRVRTGTYGVNQYMPDLVAPFGGYKSSGIGREFGREGLDQYTEIKSISVPAGSHTSPVAAGSLKEGVLRTEAAICWAQNEPWSVEAIELDPPKAGEVRIQYIAAGLCHSDDHLVTGDMGFFWPIIGGHEGAGIVVDVGPGVTRVAPGDHVVPGFVAACGRCPSCVKGHSGLCDNGALIATGMQLDGTTRHHAKGQDIPTMASLATFAKYGVIPELNCVKIDHDIPLEVAALVGCGVSTGWGSAVYAAEVQPGETVAVIGVGGIGAAAIQGARMAGADRIIAIDPVDLKRELAPRFGATHTYPSVEEATEAIREETWGRMCDKVICSIGVGRGDLMASIMGIVGKRGRCVVTNIHPIHETQVSLSMADLTLMEKQIVGALFGSARPNFDIPNLLRLYQRGHLDLEGMITNRYKLGDINQGYKDMKDGKNIRGIIVHDH
ncbi:aldehyde dehydrogenase family protein [Mycobacterium palustre]|uniref:aldehyde dehydrogenase family protein n=1 Tax=Mycobacterium palustre TaxID=153971 RepID=UPI000A156BC9|nr:aldehyde dehydrogenase family protein [Mycobacterium palustre]MCV7101366.1 aldehyde dehydrogenase family protein [Mycobacterium palustre]